MSIEQSGLQSADNIMLRPCAPYYFTNDPWTAKFAGQVASQQDQPEVAESVALMLGPAGLPHTLGLWGVSHIVQVDISQDVLDVSAERIKGLHCATDWEDYFERDVRWAIASNADLKYPIEEYEMFEGEGMLTDASFAEARQAAERIHISRHVGNILDLGSTLADTLDKLALPLSVAHLTNVHEFVRDKYQARATGELAGILQPLPKTDNFRVISSCHANVSGEGSGMFFDTLEKYGQGYALDRAMHEFWCET